MSAEIHNECMTLANHSVVMPVSEGEDILYTCVAVDVGIVPEPAC
jgi:hypothetical protein